MKKIAVILFCLSVLATYGQKLDRLSIALMSETHSFPFTRYLPVHPGLEAGLSLWSKQNGNHEQIVSAYLGGYHHKLVENGFYLRGEYVYRYKLLNSIGLDVPLHAGYQHNFYPGTVYEQDTDSGDWVKKTQIGKSHLITGVGFGLTWIKSENVQPFIRQESTIEVPLYNGFVNLRTFVKLGVNIKISQNEN